MDWEPLPPEQLSELYRLAHIHQVLPLVYESTYPSQGVHQEAKSIMMRSTMLQALKTRDFLTIIKQMNEAGLHPLVVKGIIARHLYPIPDERVSGDEDLFITPEEFQTYHQFFLEHHFTPGEDLESYEVPYQLKGSSLYIELHKTLFPQSSKAYGSWNSFFASSHQRYMTENIQGVEVSTMCPDDHFLYLILHAFKHFLHSGVGIRQVADIMMYARHYEINYEWVFDQLQLIHAEVFGASLLSIGQHYLIEAPIPEKYLSLSVDTGPLLKDILEAGVYGNSNMSRKHSSNITLEAITIDKQGKKAHASLKSTLFPNRKDLMGRYPYLEKYGFLLPVAWLSRILSYMKESSSRKDNQAVESIRIGKERVALLKDYKIIK